MMYKCLVLLTVLAVQQTVASITSNSGNGENKCVSQQQMEDIQRQVDTLQSQLNYWQSVTINILKDLYFSSNSVRCNAMTGSFHNPAHNCSHIAQNNFNVTSGYYWLQNGSDNAVQVYCDMERVCGCDEGRRGRGGWMRVADIDMTRHEENCPTGFREVTVSGKRMCGGRNVTCVSTNFSSHGVEYSRVCGRIIGYQFGQIDAFWIYNIWNASIDIYFLDGIVLTYGFPRSHIWSFVGGSFQGQTNTHGCPCNSRSSHTIPPYVQNDYFCDSGHSRISTPSLIYYLNDPLWDGAGCVRGCCQFNSPPWFCKDLPHPTSDDIELRTCISANIDNEDILFELVEIYVQ